MNKSGHGHLMNLAIIALFLIIIFVGYSRIHFILKKRTQHPVETSAPQTTKRSAIKLRA